MWAIPKTAVEPLRQDLNLGRANDALQRLDAIIAQNPGDAQAHNLRCRVYYEEMQWNPAIADCEAAVRLDPNNSNYHLWLGRAYGQKARHASVVSAYGLAHKVHAEFTKAVELDPQNARALADLGEFDASAPAVAGGGVSHAAAVVQQLQGVDPAAALTLLARIAEAKKNDSAAESDLKAAIALSPYPADAWMDLAAFYLRHHRIDDMVAAAHKGASLDRAHGPALVDGATDLASAGREPQTAIQWLEEYLASRAQTESAPSFAVRALLAELLERQGDAAAAQQQIAAAHALASGYRVSEADISTKAGL